MKITYDPEADAAYLQLVERVDGEIAETLPVEELDESRAGGFIFDFDDDGRLLGIEVLGARRALRQATLASGDVLD
jgi:uncharacterized protein YuzE